MLSAFAASAAVASGASVDTLIEYSNGHTVTVNPGQHVTRVLHSTYWSIAALPTSRPLTQVTSAVYSPRLPSTKGGCVAGQGRGTVTGALRGERTGRGSSAHFENFVWRSLALHRGPEQLDSDDSSALKTYVVAPWKE